MAAFNEDEYIEEAVRSVLEETEIPLELIVVNDRSTDNTYGILEKIASTDNRLFIINRADEASKENVDQNVYFYPDHGYGGQTDALNLGLRFCRGQYIARLDADDACMADRFKIQLEYMVENPDISFLGAGAIRINAEGCEIGGYHPQPLVHEDIIANLNTFRGYCAHSSWLIRAAVYSKLDGYHRRGFRAEDLDFMLRASELENVNFAYIHTPLIRLRMQDGRLSTGLSMLPINHSIAAVVRHNLRLDGLDVSGLILEDEINTLIEKRSIYIQLSKCVIGYRAMVNVFVNFKSRKFTQVFDDLKTLLKFSPMMIFNRNMLSLQKLEVAKYVQASFSAKIKKDN